MIHDLTMTLDEHTLPFPSGDEPRLSRRLLARHEEAGVQVTALTLGTHLGTHADAPLHFLKKGRSVAEVELRRFFGPAVCLRVPGIGDEKREINLTEILSGAKDLIRTGDILLFYTGWERKAGTAAYFRTPSLACNTGALLDRYGAAGIGVDMPSVGDYHPDILGRGLGVIECLVGLEPLVGRRFLFSALPLKIPGGDGCPVRACALTDD